MVGERKSFAYFGIAAFTKCSLCSISGKVGKLFLDVRFWKAMARVCHRWAEDNPNEAKKSGASASRLAKKQNGKG